MTTVTDIVDSARARMAEIPTSRDAGTLFKEHLSDEPFEQAPSSIEGFDIIAEDEQTTQGFGIAESKEEQFYMVVKLGHFPFGTDKEREQFRSQDRARVTDLLERHTYPSGTSVVLYETQEIDKRSPNWWVTTMRFKVVYMGAIETE